MVFHLRVPRSLTVVKWLYCVILGMATGAVSFLVSLTVSNVYGARSALIFDILLRPSFFTRLLLFMGFNLTFAITACLVTVFFSLAAVGSGIPEIKAYLNGARVPGFLSWQSFVAKVVGAACAVSSNLAVGKEGPSVHIGSIIAGMMGRSWLLKDMQSQDPSEVFHTDRDCRDLVVCGASAGLAAAFGVPLAGVFFGLEIATTRWRAELTWRSLLTCAISVWTAKLMSSGCTAFPGLCGQFNGMGVLHINSDFKTPWNQVVPVTCIGVFGGLAGALFTKATIHIQKWRLIHRKTTLFRLTEVIAVCSFFSVVSFALIHAGTCIECDWVKPHCSPGSQIIRDLSIQCPESHYNDMAVLVFSTQPTTIRSLLLSEYGEFSSSTLALYAAVYFVNAVVSYGLTLPSGLFTPSIIFGAVMGRLYAHALHWSGVQEVDSGLYSLLGIAGFFGGGLRFTAASAVMLLEMTQSEEQLPFIIMTLMIAKAMADRFSGSIPDEIIRIRNLSFFTESLPRWSKTLTVSDVMTAEAQALCHMEPAKYIRRMLNESGARFFPVNFLTPRDLIRSHISRASHLSPPLSPPVAPASLPQPDRGGDSCQLPVVTSSDSPHSWHKKLMHRLVSNKSRQPAGSAESSWRSRRGSDHPGEPHATQEGQQHDGDPGQETCFIGTVDRRTLEMLISSLEDEDMVDLRSWAKPSLAIPEGASLAGSYDMCRQVMLNTGVNQVPVVASYGPAIGVMDRSELTYNKLKRHAREVAHRRQLEARDSRLDTERSLAAPLLEGRSSAQD